MFKRLVLTCALLTAPLLAQTAPSPNLAGIAHIALRVANLDASIAFYQKLGFVKAFDLSRDGKVYEAFIKINDHQFIELYPTDAKNPQVGFLHVCFEGNDLQSVHDYYVSKGLTPNAVRTAGAGNLLFTMPGPMTPQGPQNIEYTQYMPGSLHSKDFGQHLGPDRVGDEMSDVVVDVEDRDAARTFYVDKAGFRSDKKNPFLLHLPGSVQTIDLETAAEGHRANIMFLTSGIKKAAAQISRAGIFVVNAGLISELRDPDGNLILVEQR